MFSRTAFRSLICLALSLAIVRVDAQSLSDTQHVWLDWIKAKGCAPDARITSSRRTITKQVELLIKECNNRSGGSCKKEHFATDYASECADAIRQAYPTSTERLVKALTEDLKAAGEDRTCMAHVDVPGLTTRYVAIDVDPSSVPNKRKFYDAVLDSDSCAVASRFFHPDGRTGWPEAPKQSAVWDRAFHIEFPREGRCSPPAVAANACS